MIKSFAHKGLEQFFYQGSKRGIRPRHAQLLADILDMLDAAAEVGDMDAPGLRLHPWRPRNKGYWSVDVNGPWRVIFRFQDGDAYDVDYRQPH